MVKSIKQDSYFVLWTVWFVHSGSVLVKLFDPLVTVPAALGDCFSYFCVPAG